MPLLFDRLFHAVALGHFAVDFLNGNRAVLLAFLSVPLGLTNSAIGLFSTIYVVSGSLTQPIFGWLTDRFGPRWILAGGILWIAVFYGIAMVVQGYAALWLLLLGSFGSAAFHPAGTMQATLSGQSRNSGRETESAAYFFVFGQLGLFFGPITAGPLLENFGLPGLLPMAVLAVLIGLMAMQRLKFALVESGDRSAVEAQNPGNRVSSRAALVAFIALAAFQSWSQQNMITFVPKYLLDLGKSASVYGFVAALFMGGSAIGTLIGGALADRFGKRKVAMIGLSLASVPLLVIAMIGWSPWLYFLIPLAGALTGATHSIIVVLAQRMIPSGMALASGLILGFMFTSGALGTLFSGFIADIWGFAFLFQFTAGIVLAAAGLAFWLQRT